VATVALMPHHDRPAAVDLARRTIDWLAADGHAGRVPDEDASATGLDAWACPDDKLTLDLDLAVSLGGDGTMLRTVNRVVAAGVPVLGVNVGGRLGYLTEVEPADLQPALERFLAGSYRVEERLTLEVALEGRSGTEEVRTALNEAVLEKTLPGHTVRLGLTINERPFATYAADGLIVATPTGSTAYNLSARGPIVSPRHQALLLTPVSPHMLFDRSLVLDAAESVRVEVLDRQPAVLVVDGDVVATLEPGEAITCRAGPADARLVTFGGRDFHGILKSKFGLADR
jgi:NAD+ kinase